MRKTSHFSKAVTVAVLLTASSAHAVPLMYGTGGYGTQLWAIDTATGAGTLIGPTGTPATFGAAWGPDGNLYTVFNSYSASGQLGRFNLTTGAVTTVTGAAVGVADLMVLEFAPTGTMYAASWATNALYTLDLSTGLPTLVGSLGFTDVMDFAFDSVGTLWAVRDSALFTVNTSTGAGTLRYMLPELGCSMGIAFDAADNLFATNYCASNSPLYHIDVSDGSVSLVGLTGISGPHGGDIYFSGIPEPGSVTLTMLGMCGVAYLRRRSVAAGRG